MTWLEPITFSENLSGFIGQVLLFTPQREELLLDDICLP